MLQESLQLLLKSGWYDLVLYFMEKATDVMENLPRAGTAHPCSTAAQGGTCRGPIWHLRRGHLTELQALVLGRLA